MKEHDHVIITNNGVGEAVLISFEDYAKYEEYLHRRFIFDELQKSKGKANEPDAEPHDAKELFARLESKSPMDR